MTFRLSSFGMSLALVIGGSILFANGGNAQQTQRGRSIEFSDRKSSEVATNLNQMGSRKGNLQQRVSEPGESPPE